MALSRAEIQKKSDIKRGVCTKTYRLSREDVRLIDKLADQSGIARGQLIAEAVREWAEKRGLPAKD